MRDFTARFDRDLQRHGAPPTRAAIIHPFPEPAHAAPVPPRDRRARSAGALGRYLRVSRDRGAARKRRPPEVDRKSTRLNSSHTVISYAVFCLKKKKQNETKPNKRETRA